MNGRKKAKGIVEAEKRYQRVGLNEIAEERLGGAIRCNARGHYDPRAPSRTYEPVNGFGKNGVGIDAPDSRERIAIALTNEFAEAIGSVDRSEERRVGEE